MIKVEFKHKFNKAVSVFPKKFLKNSTYLYCLAMGIGYEKNGHFQNS